MEGGATNALTAPPPPPPYSLSPSLFMPEDILFCVDVGPESRTEMRISGPKGLVVTRLDAIKQSLLLFAHAKLTMSTDHRFAFSCLTGSFSWAKKEFTNNIKSIAELVLSLAKPNVLAKGTDITKLFEVANSEGKKSRSQGRLLRVLLIYCQSSVLPQHMWPAKQKTFTLDVVYLHDKPGPDNCPQLVYDAFVDAVEQVSEYEGYILESGQGLTRVLFRHMCVLLAHPFQRCAQDDIDVPRSIVKRVPPGGVDREKVVISNFFKH